MDSASKTLYDWELDVEFKNGKRCHHVDNRDQCWKQVEKLGEGTCGEVWKEQCVPDKASSSVVFRAVKHIDKRPGRWTQASMREIEALTTFSNEDEDAVSNQC